MEINHEKTKIMIFEKSFAKKQTPIFHINEKVLETTQEYTYLGVKLTHNGKFTIAVKQLAEKALRAINITRKSLNIHALPPKLAIKIFDRVISPILLYNSEVWGAFSNCDFNKWEQSPTEITHSKFCKIYLGVNRKATNIACKGELGKFTLLFPIFKKLFRYVIHINSLPDSTLVKQAFLLSKNLNFDNKSSFYTPLPTPK